MSRPVTIQPPRAGCAAARHDTEWAYDRYGCCCPDAVAAKRRKHRADAARRRSRLTGGQRCGRIGRDDTVHADRVDLAVAGRRVQLNPAELAAAIGVLAARGIAPDGTRRPWSAYEIARQVGCTERTVQRHKAAQRAAKEAS